MRLLLVEDSARIRRSLARALAHLGHAVDEAENLAEARISADINHYDAILLDLLLPDGRGLSLLETWRRQGNDTPVIVLTALDAVEDRVRGLALGADDYVTKPFAIEEVAARLEAVVRRRHGQADSLVRVGALEIDLGGRTVRRQGEAVVLTAREFSLLECLARHPGRILTREQIEAHLYAEADSPVSNAVDAAIYALRRKLCPPGAPQVIHTRRGLGYVLEES